MTRPSTPFSKGERVYLHRALANPALDIGALGTVESEKVLGETYWSVKFDDSEYHWTHVTAQNGSFGSVFKFVVRDVMEGVG